MNQKTKVEFSGIVNITKRIYLYGLLVASIMAQVVLLKYVVWFPDITLLIVVFAGIFLGAAEGIMYGLVAGVLRGCFSVHTFFLDIFLFPLAGMISALLSGMFYRQNPAAQMFITSVVMVMVITAHTFYLNSISGNDIGVAFVLTGSWRTLAMTAAVSPLAFAFLKGLWQKRN